MSLKKANLLEVFDAAQRSVSSHKKALERMKVLIREDGEDFTSKFMALVYKLLSVSKKEESVERLMKLVVSFVEEEEVRGELKASFLSHLLQFSNAKENFVRTKVATFLSSLLSTSTPLKFVPSFLLHFFFSL